MCMEYSSWPLGMSKVISTYFCYGKLRWVVEDVLGEHVVAACCGPEGSCGPNLELLTSKLPRSANLQRNHALTALTRHEAFKRFRAAVVTTSMRLLVQNPDFGAVRQLWNTQLLYRIMTSLSSPLWRASDLNPFIEFLGPQSRLCSSRAGTRRHHCVHLNYSCFSRASHNLKSHAQDKL